MQSNILLMYKHLGETPLSAINRLKHAVPTLATEKISYAGRLDPMAEGLVLLLIGQENKKRNAYEDLSKTYIVEILLGISTDTYDLLGLHTNTKPPTPNHLTMAIKELHTFLGINTMPYPPYSSKPVNGKPLYYWSRKNLLDTIIIPEKKSEIYKIDILSTRKLTGEEVVSKAKENVGLITGDFRQDEIQSDWETFGKKYRDGSFFIAQTEVSCSSGTYMRTIANSVGEKIGIPSLAYSIKRTAIGDFTIKDVFKLDDREPIK